MELIWNERNGARVVYCGVAQALVEGCLLYTSDAADEL